MTDLWTHRTTGEVVLLDNRDSFVYNLAHRFFEVGTPVVVVRSDRVTLDELKSWGPRAVVISPGPGHPRDAGCSVAAVREFSGKIPVLGVCLGHQAIAEAFGGSVAATGAPRYGKASAIEHDGTSIFDGLPQPLEMGRYHGLSIVGVPDALRVTASVDRFVMAVEHREHRHTVGVQFHPESVLSPQGTELLRNFSSWIAS